MLSKKKGRTPRAGPDGAVVLIGFMGAGKSKVGTLVAERLGRPFVDTDDLVVAGAGKPISAIFATDGEPAFRRMETAAIAEALAGEPRVIALGGGAATRETNWALLRTAGAFTIYLRATPEIILERVEHHTHRPLLAGLDRTAMLDKITRLLAEREPWYLRADAVIASDNTRDKNATADEIVALFAAANRT